MQGGKMSKVILIVDDQPINVKLLHVVLRKNGYTTLEAIDGKQGVEMARAQRPDLILMDKNMPVMDGLEATQVLKEDNTTKDIPIICISSSAMKGDREIILESGCDEYISKPVDIYKVLEIVAQYIQRQ
jgi:CheY-like chemotaxis protein